MGKANYCCKRCGYETNRKSNFRHHISRKTLCKVTLEDIPIEDIKKEFEEIKSNEAKTCDDPVPNFKCEHCQATYMTRQGLKRHMASHDQSDSNKFLLANLETIITNIVTKLLEKGVDKNPTIHNDTNIQHQENNHFHLNVIIHPYGSETTSHISPDFLTRCLVMCNQGMKELLHKLYFDPNVPENRTIRFKSVKQRLLERMGPEQNWIQCDKSTTIDEMIAKGHRLLLQHFIQNMNNAEISRDNRPEFIQKWMSDICSKSGRNYFDLRRDIFWMIKDNTVYLFD